MSTYVMVIHLITYLAPQNYDKRTKERTSGNKLQIHNLCQFVRHVIPQFSMPKTYQWTVGKAVGTKYGLSSNGWVDTIIFKRSSVEICCGE